MWFRAVVVCVFLVGCTFTFDRTPDAGQDAGTPDGGPPDAGSLDAGSPDAGATFPCGSGTCTSDGLLICISNQCEPALTWTQWLVPADAPADSNYTVSNGIVTDSKTGLVWQQVAPADPCPGDGAGGCTWAHAQTYCQGLNGTGLGGFTTGWRLPEIIELQSIVNRSKTDTSAAIDLTAFPDTTPNYFWTNTLYVGSNGYPWVIDYFDGASYYNPVGNTYAVRCVRSLPSLPGEVAGASAPPGRYVIANGGTASGTVYDVVTHLTWQQGLSLSQHPWSSTNAPGSAQAYCASQNGLNLGGFSTGWRLPTVNELLSIVDFGKSSPAIDQVVFPMTPGPYFWTSTSYTWSSSTGYAWLVSFYDGLSDGSGSSSAIGSANAVRCVR